MISYYDLPEDSLPMSMRHFRRILQERGWKAEKFYPGSLSDLVLTRPDGKELRIYSSTPPTTSVFALHLADNKMMTQALLKLLDVPHPETVEASPETVQDFLDRYGTVVIKPIDGAHGNGITIGVTDLEEAAAAIERAKAASPALGTAIVQPQLPLDALELRVICINYCFVEAIARIPAAVTGDGEHTLMELIDSENATLRSEAYKSDLAYIDRNLAVKFLGERQEEIPAAGEKVRVVASCNVGQGGTTEDYSDKITTEMREMSEKIAKAAQLPVIGIDFYGDQVIEVNACPSLYYPTGDDAATRAVYAYVDYLEQL